MNKIDKHATETICALYNERAGRLVRTQIEHIKAGRAPITVELHPPTEAERRIIRNALVAAQDDMLQEAMWRLIEACDAYHGKKTVPTKVLDDLLADMRKLKSSEFALAT